MEVSGELAPGLEDFSRIVLIEILGKIYVSVSRHLLLYLMWLIMKPGLAPGLIASNQLCNNK